MSQEVYSKNFLSLAVDKLAVVDFEVDMCCMIAIKVVNIMHIDLLISI